MSSPTQRSKALMEERGYTVEIVEKWIPGANIRKDFLGFGDLLCMRADPPDVVLVQTTSDSNLASRVNKITESVHLALVRALGWGVHVHGWGKRKNRWQVRERDLS